ncbi:MAG: CBS domain-containing protein [Planctomycetota bacterium]
MGDQNVNRAGLEDERNLGKFEKTLLADLRALEYMIEHDSFETGVRRIGAEQEMVLVDRSRRPTPAGDRVLATVNDARVVPELARWNVEANLSPQSFGTNCLRLMETEIDEVVRKVQEAAHGVSADVVLCGILPTLRLSDLSLASMTPNPRYYELNDSLTRLRGGQFEINIIGLDELAHRHDNIMLEAANTSFQVHFQVAPKEFAHLYNLSQLIAAPVLAAGSNSPVFAGRRLWNETRVALFTLSVDSRATRHRQRSHPPRVMFGTSWLENSILEIFHEDISRFRAILSADTSEDAMATIRAGKSPQLRALCLHNSTVWRWNRACYGVKGPHLRIENRLLPSGPTVLDEMANAAFYFGLMAAVGDEYGDVRKKMEFDEVRNNFLAAARQGLKAQFTWVGGKPIGAGELILDVLLPLARKGLEAHAIDSADIDRYLPVIEGRVRSGRTGSQWALQSLAGMGAADSVARSDERMRALVAAQVRHQFSGEPVHTWPLATLPQESGEWTVGYRTIGELMDTDLYTCNPADVVDLVANMMEWKRLRYVLVEDDAGRLVGIVSQRALLRLIARGWTRTKGASKSDGASEGDAESWAASEDAATVRVRDIMKATPITVTADTPTIEALQLMKQHRVGCLPVVNDGAAVGIVTAHDFLDVSARLLERHLRQDTPPSPPVPG